MHNYKIYYILTDGQERDFQVSDYFVLSVPELLKIALDEFLVMFSENIKNLKTIIIQDFSAEIFRIDFP